MYLSFFQFLLELNLSLSLGFGLYWLLLRKQTTFQWNRRFLIFWPLLCLAISSLQFEYVVWREMPSSPGGSALDYQHFFDSKDANLQQLSTFESSTQQLNNAANPSALNWWNLYFSGAIIALLLFVWRIKKLFILIRMGKTYNQDDFTILEHPAYPQIFSFGRYIFKQKDQEIPEMVLAHELVHVRQRHSVDLLWMELLIILNWFNPFIYRYRKHLKETHEFIADRVVVQQYGLLDYARLLVAQATQRNVPVLALSFAAFTKKRIIAMKTKTHNPWARLRYWIILPLFLVLVTVLAIDRVEKIKPIASEADATVQWGELTCDCYESSMQGMYFCDLEEVNLTAMAQLTRSNPNIYLSKEGQIDPAQIAEFTLKKKSGDARNNSIPIYFSDTFFDHKHKAWENLKKGDKFQFKAHLSDERIIEFSVGITREEAIAMDASSFYLANDKKTLLSFDPISNITQLTLTKEQFEQLIARPIVLVEQDRQNHPEVSVSITRALHTDQINYSLYSTLLAKKSEKIDLQSTVLLSDIQPGETITISFISKESDENYTALIKIAGDYPFLKRDFRLRWGEYDVSHPILTLDAQDLFALEKAALSILLDGKQLKQTDRPIIGSYASGRNDGKWAGYSLRNPAYFPYSELPELIEDRLVEMQEFVQAKQEGKTYQRFLRSRPILIPYEEDKYLPLIIALDQDKPSFKTSDQILLGPHQLSYPINPVNIQKISSGFGPRVHPIYKVKRLHRGIDLIAPLGTPILAAAYGEVTEVEEKTDGYGKKIVIQHADGLSTVYAQLQSIGVQVGDRVQKKTIIGTLGSSGASTGPHLHFEIHEDGRPKDPMDYLPELEK